MASPTPNPARDPNGPVARPAAAVGAVRKFARFQLLRLLGKSERTMAWAVQDSANQQDYLLVMPRHQLESGAMQTWQQAVRRAGRLNHPHLARLVEAAEHERWPYVLYDQGQLSTWSERFSTQGLAAPDIAAWSAQAAQGLAFAHEAGVAHGDIQPWMLVVDDAQQVQLLGLEVAGRSMTAKAGGALDELHAVRDAAQVDVLALGLVMLHGLVGQPALDEPDVGRVIQRLPPFGQEIVRMPWAVPRPVPEPLRAIVNRATDRQQRQRYRNARTLQRALEGWLATLGDQGGGPLALLLDRFRSIGALPAQPGGADRIAHLALMDRCRTSELADVVISDIALTFELLRVVNNSKVQGTELGSDGPVLMLRRAIAMLGLDGVRRAALGLRAWPGPMSAEAAQEMEALVRRVHRTARVAVRLAPAGYDGEVIYTVALLQNLGRLLVQYHFPEESVQIRRLAQPIEASAGQPEEPGMSAEAASFAVLGVDVDELGLAVAQHWGLGEGVQKLMRRLPTAAVIHPPDSDDDILRTTCSCANELIDAVQLPARHSMPALKSVVQRYGRALGLGGREMQDALQLDLPGRPTPAAPKVTASPPQPGARAPAAGVAPRAMSAAARPEVEASGKPA